MKFELTILGTNSAIPANGRFPTAQVLNVQENYFLIDCGEGTLVRLQECDVKSGRIDQIFISHLHGDHVYGLMGLITTYSLFRRERPLDIYAPAGIREFIEVQLQSSYTELVYPLNINIVDTEKHQKIFENNLVEVHSIPLIHRIPTTGYLFREKKRKPNIRPEKIQEYSLEVSQILAAKRGEAVKLEDGRTLHNSELTIPAPEPRAFAFCSDTMYSEAIIPHIKGVDLLYHESTFLEERKERARATMHSTALQAATIAKKAAAKKLVLGHYSSQHRDIAAFELEAGRVFKNVVAGIEGMVVDIPFESREER